MEHIVSIGTYLRTEWAFVLRLVLQIGISFGIVVFIHELGHFLAAKMMGVGAPEFALGMGPEIFGVTRGDTRYKLCMFPIGGYVKLIGEDGGEDVPPELAAKNLRNKKTWQKITVIFAGPLMNFILAIFLNVLVLMVWGVPRELDLRETDLSPTMILGLVDPRSPIGKAGVESGDSIISMNGTVVSTFEQLRKIVLGSEGKPIEIKVKRGHKFFEYKVKPSSAELRNRATGKMEHVWLLGIPGNTVMPPTPRVVEAVAPRSPAASAGLMKGDIILDFDKQDYSKENQYRAAEKVTALLVYRKGAKPDKFGIEIGPDKARIGQDIGLILQPVNQRMGVISAIKVGSWRTVYIIVQTGVAIKMMVNREMTAEGLAGPVGIIQYASTFARSGIQEFIFFFAAISVTLAIVNLIPFPALDGSLIAFFLWEGITKRPMDPKKQGMIIYVGFCILIGLIILLTIRDARLWLGM